MVRYFYAWIPVVLVGVLFVLSLPWLGLFAVAVGAAMLAALAWAVVSAPFRIARAVALHRHGAAAAFSLNARDGAAVRPPLREEGLS